MYRDTIISFHELLKKDNFFTLHHRNTQGLAIELHKIKESLSNEIGSSIFPPRLIKYNFRTLSDFLRISVNNSKHGVNPTRFFASKVWQIVSMEMKNLKNLEDFKSKIRKCEPDGCDCKLYKVFTSNLEY